MSLVRQPRLWRRLTALAILFIAPALVCALASEDEPAVATASAERSKLPHRHDPARIEGHAKCVDCHKLEVQALLHSKHSARAFDLLRTSPTAREYARKLDIPEAKIARDSLCVDCHATRRIGPTGLPRVIAGVTCESCHNPSGGEDGWLNRHAVYGPPGTRREEETDQHYQSRRQACQQAGQLTSSEIYQLVKRCYQCHIVPDEALALAGHDHGEKFLLTERLLGEVRHNFLFSGRTNSPVSSAWTNPLHGAKNRTAAGRKRVLFIVGQLVDLEISLRNLATASDENDFSDLLLDRIGEAFELLSEDLMEELEETEIPEVEQALAVVEPVWEKLDDDGFDPDDKQAYLEAAEKVAAAAKMFSRRDGNQLAEIDDFDLIPQGPYNGVYQP